MKEMSGNFSDLDAEDEEGRWAHFRSGAVPGRNAISGVTYVVAAGCDARQPGGRGESRLTRWGLLLILILICLGNRQPD